ncbi:MAG: PEP-CTERM sorting domain-containing protein [Bryobacteraceae bacterium]
MRRVYLVPLLLACVCLPLSATIITFEDFTSAGVPSGDWSTSISSGYGISIPGTGVAVFSRSASAPGGTASLTYTPIVSGDFLAVGVVDSYSLVNGTSMVLEAHWSGGSDLFTAAINQAGGVVRQMAGNSLTAEFPSAPFSSPNAVLVLYRTGNNIRAGVMGDLPVSGGVPDFSGLVPLGNWTGDQYLGDMYLSLSFGSFGAAGDASASVDIFALATPPYAPDIIPPAAGEIPEPATAVLLGGGMAVILLLRRRRAA